MALCKVKTGPSTWKYVISSMKQRMGEYKEKINEYPYMLLINSLMQQFSPAFFIAVKQQAILLRVSL